MHRFILLFSIVASCFSVSAQNDTGTVELYIYRIKNFFGSATSVNININGTNIGKLKNGGRKHFSLHKEGVLKIEGVSSSPRHNYGIKMAVQKGEKRYIELKWTSAYTFQIRELQRTDGAADFYNEDFFKGDAEELDDAEYPVRIYESELAGAERKVDLTKVRSSGSGFFISTDGYIVTNYHVIEDHQKLFIRNKDLDASKKYEAQAIVVDKVNDLAIIKITDPNFQGIHQIPYVLNPKLAEVGEGVFALGFPLTTTMGYEVKLTDGIISSRTGFADNIVTYQVSVPVQPGNSGGPLFNKRGELIGIVSAIHRDAENVSYAIKSNYLVNLIYLLPNLEMNRDNSLQQMALPDQVKAIEHFMVLVENY